MTTKRNADPADAIQAMSRKVQQLGPELDALMRDAAKVVDPRVMRVMQHDMPLALRELVMTIDELGDDVRLSATNDFPRRP